MTKALSDFYNHLLPQLPGCTPEFLDNELREVLRDYARRSRCWRETLPTIVPVSGERTYQLSANTGRAELCGITQMAHGADLWWRSREHKLQFDTSTAQAQGEPRYLEGEPPFACSDDFAFITFDQAPTSIVTLTGWVRPAYTMTAYPDFLFLEHLAAIRAGVFERVMSMPGKPWTDMAMAADYRVTYNSKTGLAASRSDRGNNRGPLRTGKSFI